MGNCQRGRGCNFLYQRGAIHFATWGLIALLAGCAGLEKFTAPVDLDALRTLQKATQAVETQGVRLLIEHKDRLELLADDGKEKPSTFNYIRIPELEINRQRVAREESVKVEIYALQVLNAYAQALVTTKASSDPSVYQGAVNVLSSLLSVSTGATVLGQGLELVLSGLADVQNHIAVVDSLRSTIELDGVVAHPVIHLLKLLDSKAILLLARRHTDYTGVIVSTTIEGKYQTEAEAFEHRLKLNMEINGFLTAIREYRGLLDQTRGFMDGLISGSAEASISSRNLLDAALFVTWRADRLGEIVDRLTGDAQLLRGVFQ